MVDSKQRSSPDDTPDERQAEKQLDRTDPPSRSSTSFDDALHEKLLKKGLSFRMLVERAIEHAIFALDCEGHVASWNDGAEKIKGYTAKEIIGQHVSRFYTAEDIKRDHPTNLLKAAEAQGQVADEGWRVRKDGTVFWADITITALRDKKGVLRGFGKVTRDATRRKRAEEALGELSSRLLEAQDRERRRIALELNDRTSPSFSSLLAKLYQLQKRAEESGGSAVQLARDSISLAETLSTEITIVSQFLNPPLLDKEGLLASLRWHIERFVKQTGISVNMDFPEKLDRLLEPAERALYRITQECLTDIFGRSGTSRVNVRLFIDQEYLTLEMRDEGRGLPPALLESLRKGTGDLRVSIAGMRELMKQFGGLLNVTPSESSTSVTAILPVRKNAREPGGRIVHDDRSSGRVGKEMPVALGRSEQPEPKQNARSQNVSSSGMRLTTEAAWRPGEQALVSTKGGVWTEARIVYCEYLGSEKFAVGLELVKPAGNWANPN
jgi:PAS domain S-box-containing protein